MTEQSPATNQSGIDNIAVSAVDEFRNRARPLREDTARLVDLVLPLIPRLSNDSLRRISSGLALSQHAPKPLLLALCDFPVAICSPILTRSNALNSAELLAIVSQHGEEHARAIARRSRLERRVVDALRSLNSAGVDRALDLRQRIEQEQAAAPKKAAANPFDAYRSSMHGDMTRHAKPLRDSEMDDLISLAADSNRNLLHTALADALGLTVASASALCADPTSKNLLYALRFMDAPAEKAYDVFKALQPDIADREGVRERFLSVYTSITTTQAVHQVWRWRSEDLLAIASQAFAANDPGTPEDTRELVEEPQGFPARVA